MRFKASETSQVALRLGAASGRILAGGLLCKLHTLVECLCGRRDIVRWVEKAEIIRAQPNLCHFGRHNWEVLYTRVMSEAVSMPDDNIIVSDRVSSFANP